MRTEGTPEKVRPDRWAVLAAVALMAIGVALLAPQPVAAEAQSAAEIQKQLQDSCAKLDNPKYLGMMDGLLPQLIERCGRQDLLGMVREESAIEPDRNTALATDAAVSNPALDTPTGSHTQSETSMAYNPTTGTLCSAFNDSFHGVAQGLGFSGFSRSTDQGLTWTDKLNVSSDDSGDPAMIWRKVDGKFYYAALRNGGLGFYRSDDDCNSFTFVSQISSTNNDDKELAAVDNNPASPNYGRIYVAWTDFTDARITVRRSSDAGATWSAPVKISAAGEDVQGAWPAVAPNGDVYVAWLHWLSPGFPSGNIEAQIARSTDGGATFSLVTPPMTNKTNPRDTASTSSCGRPALKGNVRYLPSPEIAVGADGVLHAVYTYDPDATGSGDVTNAYYRRSTDSGATWGTEVQVNDDGGTNDQYQASLSVTDAGVVTVGWYDRRNDVNNVMIEYFARQSFDGGVTWSNPSVKIADVPSPIFLDPSLATCYHGDYDTQGWGPGFVMLQWSDDRNIQGGHNDPDVHGERIDAGTDFLVTASPNALSVCAPDPAVYNISVPQFQGFSESVTLSASGNPAGSTVGFGTNPVTPPGASVMTVTTTGATVGDATITVTGTSSPSSIMHSANVALSLFDATPGTPTLSMPANGATNVAVNPTFTWSAGSQAETYTLEVATDAGFTNIVVTETGISGTSSGLSSTLNTNVVYFWRVRAINPCNTGANSTAFTFTTIPAPGDCAIGVTPQAILTEGFEGGTLPAGWTSDGTGNSWTSSTARFHSGARSFFAADPAVVSDQHLVTPAVSLPAAAAAPISLVFWQHQTIEDSGTGCFDGAVVEVSTNGGTSWTRLEAEVLLVPYDGLVSTSFSNPIAGTNAWCGDPRDWSKTVVDLNAFAGQAVKLRFRLASDSSVSHEGWYVDDVVFQSCAQPLFADGFETGDTSAWSLTVP